MRKKWRKGIKRVLCRARRGVVYCVLFCIDRRRAMEYAKREEE